MIQSVRELFEAIQDETAKGCPHKFILKDIRTNHLKKHWSNLALILVRCFDGNKGGLDQTSMEMDDVESSEEEIRWAENPL